MKDNWTDRVEKKYGFTGLFFSIVGIVCAIFAWLIASIEFVWPFAIPVIAAWYMIWSVRE